MKISDLRDWATATFGLHSHKEGQIHAALGPLEEWLGHLARQGIMLEVTPTPGSAAGAPAPPLHPVDEPPSMTNAGATGYAPTVEIPMPATPETPETPLPDPDTFVADESAPHPHPET